MKSKTYFLTYLLFLLTYFLSLLLISVLVFNNQIKSAKQQALAEHFLLNVSIARELEPYLEQETFDMDNQNKITSLLEYYGRGYINQNSSFRLLNGKEVLYPLPTDKNSDNSSIAFPGEDNARIVTMEKRNGEVYVDVMGALPHSEYYFLEYSFMASEHILAWKQIRNILLLTGILSSVIMAILLLVSLSKVFRPFELITSISRKVSKGDYEQKIPIEGKGELREMAVSFNRMTDEICRQIVMLSNVAEQKQQFIDNLSHELRTPLTSIYGYAEYMKNADVNLEEREEAIDFIMSESKSIIHTSNSLLELASHRNQELIFETIDMQELFSEIEDAIKLKLSQQELEFIYSADFDVLYGDRDLIKVLLLNLITNAIKVSPKGSRVTVIASLKEGCKIISVSDCGKGISEEHIENITEPFYRIDKARNRKDGGVGLGLSICKQVCDSHNADLEFESVIGKGTIAKVIFKEQK